MFNRQIPARDAKALKQASHQLIETVGGVKAAADLTQATPSRMSEACSEHYPNRWLTLIQIADLEAVAGQCPVTEVLGEIAGKQLHGHDPARPEDMHQHLAHIIIVTSDVESLLARSLQDGKLTAVEVRALRKGTKNAIARLEALDDDLRRHDVARPSLAEVK
jgi:hypothetical protein